MSIDENLETSKFYRNFDSAQKSMISDKARRQQEDNLESLRKFRTCEHSENPVLRCGKKDRFVLYDCQPCQDYVRGDKAK